MKPAVAAIAALIASAATAAPTVTEADFVSKDFRFSDGKTLPALKQHYRTIGTPVRNAKGEIINAVMVGHGTGGTGAQFLVPAIRPPARTGRHAGYGQIFHHPA